MQVREIFEHLLKIGETSRDPEGVVSACLVRNGEIIVSSPSSDDSQFHAEFLVLKKLQEIGEYTQPKDVLYTTLEPCSDLPQINDGRDCVTVILEAGVKNVVYAARDPEYSTKAANRLKIAGVNYQQVEDGDLIERCARLFNSTIRKDLSQFKLPRQEKL